MDIDDESLEEFMRLYQESCDEEIDKEEARVLARDLLLMYERLAQKPPGQPPDQAANESP